MPTRRLLQSLLRLLTALMALALVAAPVTANAMTPRQAPVVGEHASAAAGSAHCQDAPDEGQGPVEAPGQDCCASMCMGIALSPQPQPADPLAPGEARTARIAGLGNASPTELATPPPRAR